MTGKWEDVAAEKRARIENSIPQEWRIQQQPAGDSVFDYPAKSGILTAGELAITESSASELVTKLARGGAEIRRGDRSILQESCISTPTGKTEPFVSPTIPILLAAEVDGIQVNCCLEFFPEAAIAQAKELDQYFETYKKPVGPLHGLPISLKDQLRIKGLETSMGYVSWVGKYDTDESVLVTLLRKAGAVFYTKTSVPQTLMVCETVNNIIGRTLNPRNKNWSCGGSSGGEGAMVGIRGGVIGVGTDIGGSIRVPSAFNFLYGIRPSHGRLPYAKMANSMEGQETVHSVVGPIAHSAADLRLFLTSVLGEEPWKYDSKVVPMPWRLSEEEKIQDKILSSGLTLGIYSCDGVVLPHPPVLRGIEIVKSVLEQHKHTVIPWTPHRHDFGHTLVNAIYTSDGCTDVNENIRASGEPPIPNIKDLLNPANKKIDMNQLWDTHLQKWAFQNEYLEKWREAEERLGKELDAIIAPITATAAIRHDQFRYYGYASVVNLLDFTSVVVPVAFADKSLDVKNPNFKPLNELDGLVQAEYDPEAYHGAPIAIQVIGRRLSEERTLAIAEEIGRLMGNSTTP
ncbi:acetamidase [Penicillium chermesinum]|uniref:amidase n=1 Tax=Penicillium chermesinum TaxID=63820 RepID=A0A9W9TTK0_9EURO|nr:acetamidase [Penicillium chermesinum]KAJ5240143.1 acetamidase [Penicillium chermesinum]